MPRKCYKQSSPAAAQIIPLTDIRVIGIPVPVGASVVRFELTNVSTSAAQNVVVIITFPSNATIFLTNVDQGAVFTPIPSIMIWNVGTLDPAVIRTIIVTFNNGVGTWTATAVTTTLDSNLSNNSASIIVS